MIGSPMETFMHALVSGSPFVQWRGIGGSDLLYLAPWILLIWLLVPKSGESKALRVPWMTVLLLGIGLVALAFLVLVAYYTVSGA